MAKASFEPVPKSAEAVRDWVRSCLAERPELDGEAVGGLAAELAASAIERSRLSFEVWLYDLADRVRVEVDDFSTVLPASEAAPLSTADRAAAVVAAVSDKWGIEPTTLGRHMWFELAAAP
jgi:hypothetical protein